MKQRNRKKPDVIFFIYAFLVAIATLFEVNRYFFPTINDNTIIHLVFVGLGTICIFGLIKRPKWFLYFFGSFTVYQCISHGSRLIGQWQATHTIVYINLMVVVMMPVIFVSLIRNRHAAP